MFLDLVSPISQGKMVFALALRQYGPVDETARRELHLELAMAMQGHLPPPRPRISGREVPAGSLVVHAASDYTTTTAGCSPTPDTARPVVGALGCAGAASGGGAMD